MARNTKPETLLRAELRKAGLGGYRLHWTKAAGRPDIAYPGKRVAIFVNGCFWHRCPYCTPVLPKANRDFWVRKFTFNTERDARKTRQLEEAGWRVMTVWECQLRRDREGVVHDIAALLQSASAGALGVLGHK